MRTRAYGDDVRAVHQRLDDITRRIDKVARTGPAAYAPNRAPSHAERPQPRETDQIAELIDRLDRRLDQFANVTRPASPLPAPPLAPAVHLPPALDRAVAEIFARQRALNGEPAPARQPACNDAGGRRRTARAAADAGPVGTGAAASHHHHADRNAAQAGRRGSDQRAARRARRDRPHADRSDAAARASTPSRNRSQGSPSASPKGARPASTPARSAGIEHGLAEVRDALRALTPAENLVGFNEAVARSRAQDRSDRGAERPGDDAAAGNRHHHAARNRRACRLQRDRQPARRRRAAAGREGRIHRPCRAPAATRSTASNIASRRCRTRLAERAQNGGRVPPRLEALVQSLTDKIEQIQHARAATHVAIGHLEDRIVSLVAEARRLRQPARASGSDRARARRSAGAYRGHQGKQGRRRLARGGLAAVDDAQARHRAHAGCARRGAWHARARGRPPRPDRAGHSRRAAPAGRAGRRTKPSRSNSTQPVGKLAVRLVEDARPPPAPADRRSVLR